MDVVSEQSVAMLQGDGGNQEVGKREGDALGTKVCGEVSGGGPDGAGELQVRQPTEDGVYALLIAGCASTGQELSQHDATDGGTAAPNEEGDGISEAGISASEIVNPDRGVNDNVFCVLQLWSPRRMGKAQPSPFRA